MIQITPTATASHLLETRNLKCIYKWFLLSLAIFFNWQHWCMISGIQYILPSIATPIFFLDNSDFRFKVSKPAQTPALRKLVHLGGSRSSYKPCCRKFCTSPGPNPDPVRYFGSFFHLNIIIRKRSKSMVLTFFCFTVTLFVFFFIKYPLRAFNWRLARMVLFTSRAGMGQNPPPYPEWALRQNTLAWRG